MNLKPGDVIILKSGGHLMTVVEASKDDVECLWMGAEGELYRETLPFAVLELAEGSDDEEDEADEEDDEEEDEEEEDEVA